jgi:putative endonuclease
MLRCRDGSLYTGATNDVTARLLTHRSGRGAAYTRSRRPLQLVYLEAARNRSAALRREAALKQLSRAEKLALLAPSSGRHHQVVAGVDGVAAGGSGRRRRPAPRTKPKMRKATAPAIIPMSS